MRISAAISSAKVYRALPVHLHPLEPLERPQRRPLMRPRVPVTLVKVSGPPSTSRACGHLCGACYHERLVPPLLGIVLGALTRSRSSIVIARYEAEERHHCAAGKRQCYTHETRGRDAVRSARQVAAQALRDEACRLDEARIEDHGARPRNTLVAVDSALR